jgi:hypothetical protein
VTSAAILWVASSSRREGCSSQPSQLGEESQRPLPLSPGSAEIGGLETYAGQWVAKRTLL